MKLLLLKILLQRRTKDEGFTLPLVIAIGLIMILLGAVNILSASEENLNAASNNQKSEALAIAEVGVARYRQLLDKNRMLTVYNSDNWSTLTNTCDTKAVITNFADRTNWKPVSNGTENIGEYRIVSYIYDIDGNPATNNNGEFAPNDDNPNTTDLIAFNDNNYSPRGLLTVKSRDANGSEAQVQVEIPIRINSNDMNNLSPALWIGDSSITNLGSLTLDGNRNGVADGTASDNNGDGNIVISKPASGGTEGCDDPTVLGNNRTIYDPRPLPDIITKPSDRNLINELGISSGGDISDDADRYNQFRGENNQLEDMLLLGAEEKTPCLPGSRKHKNWVWWKPYLPELCPGNPGYEDPEDSDGFEHFFYEQSGSFEIDNKKIATDGQSKVVLYVDGNITMNDNASLQAGSQFTRGYKSSGLQVYVEGDREITINPNGGTVRIKALVHAPDSTVKINSGGTVVIEGAMWVKNWDNSGGADVTIIPDNAGVGADRAYQHYGGTDNRAAKPITDSPTDWVVQEAEAD